MVLLHLRASWSHCHYKANIYRWEGIQVERQQWWKKPKHPFHEFASAVWVMGAQAGQQRQMLIHFGPFSRAPGALFWELILLTGR